jgi:hypothetical protein
MQARVGISRSNSDVRAPAPFEDECGERGAGLGRRDAREPEIGEGSPLITAFVFLLHQPVPGAVLGIPAKGRMERAVWILKNEADLISVADAVAESL